MCILPIHTDCTNGDIRLADGPNKSEGRLEVCENGQWGTVCDKGFRYTEALTVCRQLGFRSKYKTLAIFKSLLLIILD